MLMLFGGIAVGIESWLFGKNYVKLPLPLVAIHWFLLGYCSLFARFIAFLAIQQTNIRHAGMAFAIGNH